MDFESLPLVDIRAVDLRRKRDELHNSRLTFWWLQRVEEFIHAPLSSINRKYLLNSHCDIDDTI